MTKPLFQSSSYLYYTQRQCCDGLYLLPVRFGNRKASGKDVFAPSRN